MAKQTKSASAPAPATPPTAAPATAAPAEPKKKGAFGKPPGDKDVFVRILGEDGKGVEPTAKVMKDGKEVRETIKLAPQAMVIVNTIEAAGPKGISRKELCEKLPAAGLVTRQPVGRIVSYYQKPILEAGCVTLTKVS